MALTGASQAARSVELHLESELRREARVDPIQPYSVGMLKDSLRKVLGLALADKSNTGRVLTGPLRGSVLQTRDKARLSYWLGTYEGHVTSQMRKHLRSGMVSYDVGGHIGYLTLLQSQLVGRSGRVTVFEPDPRNVDILERNLVANGVENVTVVPKAVTARSGFIQFATFDYSFVNHIAGSVEPADAIVLRVPSVSLDDYVFKMNQPAPDCIKIDVEGAEDDVFIGAKQVIKKYQPVVIAEVRRHTFDVIASEMENLGYRSMVLEGGNSRWRYGLADFVFLPEI